MGAGLDAVYDAQWCEILTGALAIYFSGIVLCGLVWEGWKKWTGQK